MTKIDRANFGSKLGVILASAGSAVGLGNIWRFPYETGNHGGAAFILIYLGCVFLLGLPILIAEFLIGRRSRANTAGAYQKLAPGTHWRWVGRMGVLAAFLILSYYSVVAGWTLEYVYEALTNGFTGKTPTEFISSFQQFSSSPWRPVLWLVLFLTHFIIVKGVEKGIEKSSKIMMPTLFIIILILVICSVTLPGAGAGIEFLLKPDFSKVDGNVFLSAMGQAFFSLSLGMGCLCTYASYFSKETNDQDSIQRRDYRYICGSIGRLHYLSGRIFCRHTTGCGSEPYLYHTAQCIPAGIQRSTDIGLYLLRHVLRIACHGSTDFHHFPARSGHRLSARRIQLHTRQGSQTGDRRMYLLRYPLFFVARSDERIHHLRIGNL